MQCVPFACSKEQSTSWLLNSGLSFGLGKTNAEVVNVKLDGKMFAQKIIKGGLGVPDLEKKIQVS